MKENNLYGAFQLIIGVSMKEASLAVLNYAQTKLNQSKVFAFTEGDNVRSIKLLNSIGMEQDGMITPDGEDDELLLFTTK